VRLSALVAELPHERTGAPGDPEIAAVTHDSRRAGPGALFAALPGAHHDGRRFVADAVGRGAAAAMGLAPAPAALAVPYIEVGEPRRAAGLAAAVLAGRPAERLVMVVVTGTSGKTTTTCLVDRVLARRHEKRGLFGTLVYRGAGGDAAAVSAAHTTPEATDLQPMLAALVREGGTAATMECSSHALVLERLAGCSFDAAVFLNLSREHLDFHRDLDDYFEAKARLFSMLKPGGKAVVNVGDPYGRRLASRLPPKNTIGFCLEDEKGDGKSTTGVCLEGEEGGVSGGKTGVSLDRPSKSTPGVCLEGEEGIAADGPAQRPCAVVIGRATLSTTGTRLEITVPAQFTFKAGALSGSTQAPLEPAPTAAAPTQFTFKANPLSVPLSGSSHSTPPEPGETAASPTLLTIDSPLLGRPNAENLLAAAATGLALGLPAEEIARSLSEVDSIPGRLEAIPNSLGLTVLVDYAHKPGALRGVLGTARSLATSSGGRVVVLFGCGGDRDRGKRPEMGRIAVDLADEVIVTSDNPRSEDPAAILREIAAGIAPAGRPAAYLVDRREAIAQALSLARPGDVVLLAGKGHETHQIIGGRSEPFDDRAVAREMLRAREAEAGL
jgi:UDP-N-acetylmuramoyl-L-alanyl-D-glutamate--2,6-diaminopimelate ligase